MSPHAATHTRLTLLELLRWEIIGAFDVLTEVALFAMAIYLVLDLRITLQLKVFVVLAFAFRVP